MTLHYQDDTVTLHHGDCLDILATLPDASVDAVVTDPPYGLANTDPAHVAATITRWVNGERDYLPGGAGFMGKQWDAFVPPVAVWDECLRVLKPGGHVLTFAGTRTVDLMTLGLRLAGFDIRDSIAWLYGAGFPKSLDVSKAIDKAGGNPLAFRRFARAYAAAIESSAMTHTDVDRHLGVKSSSCYWAREDHRGGMPPRHHWEAVRDLLNLGSDFEQLYAEAEREVIGFKGRGFVPGGNAVYGEFSGDNRITAPATEAAQKWSGWGTALKPSHEPVICARKPLAGTVAANVLEHGTGALNIDGCRVGDEPAFTDRPGRKRSGGIMGRDAGTHTTSGGAGRWPTNVVLDESQADELDQQSGESTSNVRKPTGRDTRGTPNTESEAVTRFHDTIERGVSDVGGASRFFPTFRYEGKAPQSERPKVNGTAHPTVKPLDLMRWLVRLVTPPGGTVLEPFAGSGTTVEACVIEGFKCVAIEKTDEYLPLTVARIHRRRDPVGAIKLAGDDLGLFDLEDTP